MAGVLACSNRSAYRSNVATSCLFLLIHKGLNTTKGLNSSSPSHAVCTHQIKNDPHNNQTTTPTWPQRGQDTRVEVVHIFVNNDVCVMIQSRPLRPPYRTCLQLSAAVLHGGFITYYHTCLIAQRFRCGIEQMADRQCRAATRCCKNKRVSSTHKLPLATMLGKSSCHMCAWAQLSSRQLRHDSPSAH